MASPPEIVVTGIAMPEGPSWCPDGTVVCTSVADGLLWRIWPEEGRKQVYAYTAGGANAAVPARDGSFVVTQNGGIDFQEIGVPGD